MTIDNIQRRSGGPCRPWPVIPAMLVLGLPGAVDASQIMPARADMHMLERLARVDSIQCVPYARALSGIQIFGDAWTWWDQAKGRYSRGIAPRVGAVMAFRPYGHMVLGHVAAVSRIVDARTILLRHANWSVIDGRHGQVERDVPAVDVSPANDWSQVRVWFDPAQGLGSTNWPVHGFIYPGRDRPPAMASSRLASGHHGLDVHGTSGDPIGVIIAKYQARSSPARVPMPRHPAGPAVVTDFSLPVLALPPRPSRRSRPGPEPVL